MPSETLNGSTHNLNKRKGNVSFSKDPGREKKFQVKIFSKNLFFFLFLFLMGKIGLVSRNYCHDDNLVLHFNALLNKNQGTDIPFKKYNIRLLLFE